MYMTKAVGQSTNFSLPTKRKKQRFWRQPLLERWHACMRKREKQKNSQHFTCNISSAGFVNCVIKADLPRESVESACTFSSATGVIPSAGTPICWGMSLEFDASCISIVLSSPKLPLRNLFLFLVVGLCEPSLYDRKKQAIFTNTSKTEKLYSDIKIII